MITNAPLPNFSHIFYSGAGKHPDDQELSKPWRGDDEAGIWFSRASFALEVIARWWSRSNSGDQPVFWFPDYFCNQSLEPLRAANAHIEFYPITEDLQPDWPACRELAMAQRPHLFVVVHYFGRTADLSQATQFCGEVNAILVEDATQSIGPGNGVGTTGEFVLYSPYKFFAVPDGGLMVVRSFETGQEVREIANEFKPRSPNPLNWILKRSLQKLVPSLVSFLKLQRPSLDFSQDPTTRVLDRTVFASPTARRMLGLYGKDRTSISRLRKSNAQLLRKIFEHKTEAVPKYTELEEGGSPYRFVLRSENQFEAKYLFNTLVKNAVPVESWPDLPPEVKLRPAIHSTAINLRETLLFLPVHQSIKQEELAAKCAHLD